MGFNLEIKSNDQIIKVKVTCLLDQEIRKQILSAIVFSLNIYHFTKVLVDLTESSFNEGEPLTGAIELTTYMRSIGISPETKFAFVYSDAEEHRKYFEKVANNSGYNINYFRNLNDAFAWLKN